MEIGEGRERIKEILSEVEAQIKLESRDRILKEGKKLTSEDLKIPQDPEEFTKGYIIEKVFQILGINYGTGERRFKIPGGIRKADYGVKGSNVSFLVEVKPINEELRKKSPESAVNQIKELFLLQEARDNYNFGIATEGLKWIFINKNGDIAGEYTLEKDFDIIKKLLTGRKILREARSEEEISKKFYEWYNALLHGGSFKDHENKTRSIPESGCLVNNILNVKGEEDREEIAQVIIDRLIFIKFLQAKGIIKEDILEYLSKLSEDLINSKLHQLFFNVFNKEIDERKKLDIDPAFKNIPYLNGSLFTKNKAEERNTDYLIKAEIIQKIIEFLNTFKFVSEGELEKESLNPEILGYIFEKAMTAQDRKGTGAYYTPKPITQYIAENTIFPWILDKSNELLRSRGYRESELLKEVNEIFNLRDTTLMEVYEKVIRKIKILDPACGSGAFLLSAAQILFELHKKVREAVGRKFISDVGIKKGILRNNIYGVDINHKAIEIAKLRLWLWIAESYEIGTIIEPLPNIEYNITAGNSLMGYVDINKFKEIKVSMDDYLGIETPLDELLKERDKVLRDYKIAYGENAENLRKKIKEIDVKTERKLNILLFQELRQKIEIKAEELASLEPFHWGFEFHEVFENAEKGFDVVIGNPPYGRIKQVIKEKARKELHSKLYDNLFCYQRGNYNWYKLFLERTYGLITHNGYFSMIYPTAFLGEDNSKPLRRLFFEQAEVKRILQFPEKTRVFVGVTQDVMILFYKKEKSGEDYDFVIRTNIQAHELESLNAINFTKIKRSEILKLTGRDYQIPNFHKPEIEWEILKEVSKFPPFKGNNAVEPIGEVGEGRLHETFDKEFISEEPTGDILVKGIHLEAWYVDLSPEGLQPRWIKNKEEFFKKKPDAEENAKYEKIIGRNTINRASKPRLRFSILPAGYVITNAIKFILLNEKIGVDKNYLISLLNSHLLNWRFELFSSQNNIRNYEIEALPIPRIAEEEQRPFVLLGDYLLFLHGTKERKESEKAIVDYIFWELLNPLVYELYFKEKFQQEGIYSNLASLVEPYLKDISVLKSDEEKLAVIKEVYEKIRADKKISDGVEKIKTHEWVKLIEQD